MNKYVITGGGGFIGSNLINYILREEVGAQVVAISYEKPSFFNENCKYIVTSIENEGLYEEYLDPDTSLIHLAWDGFPNNKNRNILDGITNNISHSCRLFQLAINKKCKNIVFLSSGGGIYGKPICVPITEAHPTVPLSYYGVEKLAVENYLRQMTRDSSTNAIILRPSNPYGRFQVPFRGQGVVATFLASALLNKPVEVWGDGSAVRDYCYIDDLSSAIVKSSHYEDKYLLANIGSGMGTSIKDIIDAIETVTEKELDVRYMQTTSAETGANILDCSTARDKLEWTARYSLKEGIRMMLSAWNPITEQFDERIKQP